MTSPLPAKQKAEVEGLWLEYVISGQGRPTLVLLNGAGMPVESWNWVYPELAKMGTVFAYNRAGVGKSSKPTRAQSGTVVVATLRALLERCGQQAPYVVVAHSLGGLYANLFARSFPRELSGMVLLDAAHPDDERLLREHKTLVQRVIGAAFGVFDSIVKPDKNAEIAWVPETARQIAEAGPFPDIPLTVLSGGKNPPSWLMPTAAVRVRADGQRALAAISPRGHHVIAEKSGHFPQINQPALVIQTIREVRDLAAGPGYQLADHGPDPAPPT